MSIFIHTDVTAVKLYHNFILSGIGSSISVFRKDTLEFLKRLCCLNGQKIYGFVPLKGSSQILVFGGKQYTVVTLERSEEEEGNYNESKLSRLFEPVVCNDWLHSTTWLNNHLVALLTAHNSVQVWDTTTQMLTCQYISSENSILYSGLLMPLQDGLLVLAGTVFSEIIIHIPEEKKPLHHLKGHRGVIFSVSCHPEKQIIVSTSDDRSVRIWGICPNNDNLKINCNTSEYWRNVNIVCKHEVYGHMARVMRSCITEDLIISVGEDSAICFWDYEGKLLRKNMTHQNSAIWSVDADNHDVVTGGGDGAVILHPLTMAMEYGELESLKIEIESSLIPKKLAFTARKNLVVLDESDDVIHYVNVDVKAIQTLQLNGTNNRFLSVSSCKQLIAVANMLGKLNVFVENCKDKECIRNIVTTDLNLGVIYSMQWVGNRHLVVCAGDGIITVLSSNKSEVDIHSSFVLPPCKERWLTAAALHSNNTILIGGDRCGSVHVFAQGNKNPIKIFPKVHGRYGPTSITVIQDGFITTGRDGTIKYFTINEDERSIAKYMSSTDLEFQWVEKFIDRDQNVVCGFKERIFTIHDVKNNLKLVDMPCGGGHRTWDVLRYIDKVGESYEEFVKLVYVKSNDVFTHTVQMNKIVSKNVLNSTHSKEINCLKAFKKDNDESSLYLISGGEDTTLRISSLSSEYVFSDEFIFKHLSNVRTIKTFEHEDKVIVVSGGGRAQICIKLLDVRNGKRLLSTQELVSYLIKGTDRERKHNQSWRDSAIDFDPETRIMDVEILKLVDGKFIIFAGCSDACLRVFSFSFKTNAITFEPVAQLRHHRTCILKTMCAKFNGKDILITCTTRGEVCLWDVANVVSWDDHRPFLTTRTNKCGINSLDTQLFDDKLIVATGGDDNAIHLSVFDVRCEDLSSTYLKYQWSTDKFHCSQITGAKLVDNFLLTTSIDQRVTLSEWEIEGDGVRVDFLLQMSSDIADIQGMDVLSYSSDAISVCVYGKGVEVLRIPLT